jgi:hypothetical protein
MIDSIRQPLVFHPLDNLHNLSAKSYRRHESIVVVGMSRNGFEEAPRRYNTIPRSAYAESRSREPFDTISSAGIPAGWLLLFRRHLSSCEYPLTSISWHHAKRFHYKIANASNSTWPKAMIPLTCRRLDIREA